jgi:hypothetical protein
VLRRCQVKTSLKFSIRGAAFHQKDLATFLRNHFAATVGLPFAAVVSLLVILVLRETTGKLEFEAIGFKFRGASGPVVLRVLCYLAITVSIKLLW